MFVMPEILAELPEIRRAVEAVGRKPNFTAKEFAETLQLFSLRGSDDVWSWNEIEPNRVLPITVLDDFTDG